MENSDQELDYGWVRWNIGYQTRERVKYQASAIVWNSIFIEVREEIRIISSNLIIESLKKYPNTLTK